MRISQLNLDGRGAWPDLRVEDLSAELNVFFGKSATGKSTVAQLANHLLYGKASSPWRQNFGQALPLTEGSLTVHGPQGNFVLRRHLGKEGTSRLTVAADHGGAVDSRTVQKLLFGLSPQTLSQLLAVDFAEAPRVEWLLGLDFTHELSKATGTGRRPPEQCGVDHRRRDAEIDRQRVEELMRERDTLNAELEEQQSLRRLEGNQLADHAAELERELGAKRDALDHLQADLRVVRGRIAESESRLRYLSLEEATARENSERGHLEQQEQLKRLEEEISRCRKALADLQAREAAVRAELAQVGPDGTAERIGTLVDARTTIGVLERLVDDLDAEVALLARAHEAGRCIAHDSHEKLSPVATMLRQQVYTLCGLLTEQERQNRRHQLTVEARQLSRSQFDLSERLEHLLEQRELMVHHLSQSGKRYLLRPQQPAHEHCLCEHHVEFVQRADPLLLGIHARRSEETELRQHHAQLLAQRDELLRDLAESERILVELEELWEQTQRQRAGMMGRSSVEELRFELEQVEAQLRQALQPIRVAQPPEAGVWRASDLLAKLSGGQFVQIRLDRDQREPLILDSRGQAHRLADLTPATHDQVYLALTLAIVGSFARRGIQLPVILDEPFLRQDAVSSAAMAGLLAEVARTGQQTLVFTEDEDALRRFISLNCRVFDLEKIRDRRFVEPTTESVQTTLTRVVRETEDGVRTPVLQIRSDSSDLDEHRYLTRESRLGDFPVLGAETKEVFARIKIYSVGELLNSNPEDVARLLNRKEISSETVRLWQSHMELMCSTPGLSLNDAQVLTACGIHSSAQLGTAAVSELERSIAEFFQTERGRRFAHLAHRYSSAQLNHWSHASTPRQHQIKPAARGDRHAKRPASLRERQPRGGNHIPRRSPRYHLSRESSVEDAPSIGPKTAGYLANVGVRTVADLLHCDPASLASELDIAHITAAVITDWQHQSRLVCQIPELRGYAAQLFVACNYTTPEQIARTPADEVIRKIEAFCRTKAGERILRSGEVPDRAKIRRWVNNSAQCRPLEAA